MRWRAWRVLGTEQRRYALKRLATHFYRPTTEWYQRHLKRRHSLVTRTTVCMEVRPGCAVWASGTVARPCAFHRMVYVQMRNISSQALTAYRTVLLRYHRNTLNRHTQACKYTPSVRPDSMPRWWNMRTAHFSRVCGPQISPT